MKIASLLKFSAALLLISVLLGWSVHYLRYGSWPVYESLQIDEEGYLSIEEAHRLFVTYRANFVDARTFDEYREGHITGAFSLPLRSSREKKYESTANWSKETPLVVYCGSAECTQAERLAGQLRFMGFSKVVIFTEGYEVWRDKGWPVEEGSVREN